MIVGRNHPVRSRLDLEERLPLPLCSPIGYQLLETIRQSETLSRADLARQTGHSRSTVSEEVDSLIAQNLVSELGLGSSSGGRPPHLLTFNTNAGEAVAVHLGEESMTVAVTDLRCTILCSHHEVICLATGPDVILPRVVEVVNVLLARIKHRSIPYLFGISICLPGAFDCDPSGALISPVLSVWNGVRIQAYFERHLRCSVHVAQDASLKALGEALSGLGRGRSDFVYLNLDQRIGCGVIANGHVYRGAHGHAGDLAHMCIDPQGPVCTCGHRGCLEVMASGQAIIKHAEDLVMSGEETLLTAPYCEHGYLGFEDVLGAALDGDIAVLGMVADVAGLIGKALSYVISMANPSLVIAGGCLTRFGDQFLVTLQESLELWSSPRASALVTIMPSRMGQTSCLVGGAGMCIHKVLARDSRVQRLSIFT